MPRPGGPDPLDLCSLEASLDEAACPPAHVILKQHYRASAARRLTPELRASLQRMRAMRRADGGVGGGAGGGGTGGGAGGEGKDARCEDGDARAEAHAARAAANLIGGEVEPPAIVALARSSSCPSGVLAHPRGAAGAGGGAMPPPRPLASVTPAGAARGRQPITHHYRVGSSGGRGAGERKHQDGGDSSLETSVSSLTLGSPGHLGSFTFTGPNSLSSLPRASPRGSVSASASASTGSSSRGRGDHFPKNAGGSSAGRRSAPPLDRLAESPSEGKSGDEEKCRQSGKGSPLLPGGKTPTAKGPRARRRGLRARAGSASSSAQSGLGGSLQNSFGAMAAAMVPQGAQPQTSAAAASWDRLLNGKGGLIETGTAAMLETSQNSLL